MEVDNNNKYKAWILSVGILHLRFSTLNPRNVLPDQVEQMAERGPCLS